MLGRTVFGGGAAGELTGESAAKDVVVRTVLLKVLQGLRKFTGGQPAKGFHGPVGWPSVHGCRAFRGECPPRAHAPTRGVSSRPQRSSFRAAVRLSRWREFVDPWHDHCAATPRSRRSPRQFLKSPPNHDTPPKPAQRRSFLSDTPQTAQWALKSHYLPVRKSAAGSSEFQQELAANATAKAAFDVLPVAVPEPNVAGWQQTANGNIVHKTGQFFSIEGVRVHSTPGVREIAGWDQPILTQTEGGVLALLCRETPGNGVEFLLQAKADPGNIGYLQFCPTIQSTWENIRGLKGARPAAFAGLLDASPNVRLIYRSKHNEEGSRFWQKTNENMILFVEDAGLLSIDDLVYRWASLSQIKQMILSDNVVGPYVRTIISAL